MFQAKASDGPARRNVARWANTEFVTASPGDAVARNWWISMPSAHADDGVVLGAEHEPVAPSHVRDHGVVPVGSEADPLELVGRWRPPLDLHDLQARFTEEELEVRRMHGAEMRGIDEERVGEDVQRERVGRLDED